MNTEYIKPIAVISAGLAAVGVFLYFYIHLALQPPAEPQRTEAATTQINPEDLYVKGPNASKPVINPPVMANADENKSNDQTATDQPSTTPISDISAVATAQPPTADLAAGQSTDPSAISGPDPNQAALPAQANPLPAKRSSPAKRTTSATPKKAKPATPPAVASTMDAADVSPAVKPRRKKSPRSSEKPSESSLLGFDALDSAATNGNQSDLTAVTANPTTAAQSPATSTQAAPSPVTVPEPAIKPPRLAIPVKSNEIVVIVNRQNQQELTETEIRNIFLDRISSWNSGDKIVVLNLPVDTPQRERFSSNVLGMSSLDIATEEANRSITNRRKNDYLTKSERVVVSYVGRNERAIGYVSRDAIVGNDEVRIVLTLQ